MHRRRLADHDRIPDDQLSHFRIGLEMLRRQPYKRGRTDLTLLPNDGLPCTCECSWMTVPAQIRTGPLMTLYAPIETSSPSSTCGPTIAVGWMVAMTIAPVSPSDFLCRKRSLLRPDTAHSYATLINHLRIILSRPKDAYGLSIRLSSTMRSNLKFRRSLRNRQWATSTISSRNRRSSSGSITRWVRFSPHRDKPSKPAGAAPALRPIPAAAGSAPLNRCKTDARPLLDKTIAKRNLPSTDRFQQLIENQMRCLRHRPKPGEPTPAKHPAAPPIGPVHSRRTKSPPGDS